MPEPPPPFGLLSLGRALQRFKSSESRGLEADRLSDGRILGLDLFGEVAGFGTLFRKPVLMGRRGVTPVGGSGVTGGLGVGDGVPGTLGDLPGRVERRPLPSGEKLLT